MSLTSEIVAAIAHAEGVDPSELEQPLQEHIDTEAIELLAAHETASWTLSFELPEHAVTVTSDGSILIDDIKEECWAGPQVRE